MESFERLKAQKDAMQEANFKAEAKRRGYVPATFQLINDGEEGDPRSIFPARLREARELRGMSQTDLARETSLTPDWISHFEGGRRAPSLFILWALCEALRVPADFLIGRAWGEGSGSPPDHRGEPEIREAALESLARKVIEGWDMWDTDLRSPPPPAWIIATHELKKFLEAKK